MAGSLPEISALAATQIWHFSFHVSNLDRSLAFYVDQLGFEQVHVQEQSNEYTCRLVGYSDASLRIAQLRVPGRAPGQASTHDLELVEYVRPRGEPLDMDRCRPGMSHLALVVADIHAVHSRLIDDGVQFVSAPLAITAGINAGGYCCYFLDPDGITLELVQPPPRLRAGQPVSTTGIRAPQRPAAAEPTGPNLVEETP
jgi:lactoylglutathione lyase